MTSQSAALYSYFSLYSFIKVKTIRLKSLNRQLSWTVSQKKKVSSRLRGTKWTIEFSRFLSAAVIGWKVVRFLHRLFIHHRTTQNHRGQTTIHLENHILGQFKDTHWPKSQVFVLWKEAQMPGGKKHIHRLKPRMFLVQSANQYNLS